MYRLLFVALSFLLPLLSNGQEQERPSAPDTIYYPWKNGQQLVRISNKTEWLFKSYQYSSMSQPPHDFFNTEYVDILIFRDSINHISKVFNTNKSPLNLELELAKYPFTTKQPLPRLSLNENDITSDNLFIIADSMRLREFEAYIPTTRFGVVDDKGNLIIEPKHNTCIVMDNLIVTIDSSMHQAYDNRGQKLHDTPFSAMWIDGGEFVYLAKDYKQSDKLVIHTTTLQTRFIEGLEYYYITPSRGLIAFKSGEFWGIQNIVTGQVMLEPQYESISHFCSVLTPEGEVKEKYVVVGNGGKWGLVELGGKEVLGFKYDQIRSKSGGEFWEVEVVENGKKRIIKLFGK